MAYTAESGHWYTRKGEPAYTIIGANGKERNTTLRDARKLDLVPSVTTIMGVAAKPGLENWKINQALMAALTLPKNDDESLDEFMNRAKQDAKEQAIKAAELGTQVHANIETGFATGLETTAYVAVKSILDSMFPGEQWIAEDSFACVEGYGGKIDLYSKNNIFVDFKTKDNLETSNPAKLIYDEHGMQLSAYANGMGIVSPRRVSIFIDRKDHSKVCAHEWDTATHEKHLNMFKSLLNYWKWSKGLI